MALFSQNMLELAFELSLHDPTYEDMIVKFAEHSTSSRGHKQARIGRYVG